MSEVELPRIALLPEAVRNQIAAGEVVERPASVVKELVENALDAGAQHVRVELEGGGIELVRVSDDGCGMGASDLELCFLPHATSKLRTLSDLEHIASFGFRGEALASIGAVARVRLSSRPAGPAGELGGHALENEGGVLGPLRAAGLPRGTTVEVRELFYNTPARRHFLKSPAVELTRCLDVLQRAALAHDGIGFEVFHGGKRVFDVEAALGLRERVRRTFGAELAEALVPVTASEGGLALQGFVAPPRFARGDAGRQMWFLNGRSVRDKVLLRVLRQAFAGFLVDQRQPVAFLRLSIDPAQVDVNVHPAKSEVRFREERRVFAFLHKALRAAVLSCDVAQPAQILLRHVQHPGPGEGWLPDPGALRSGGVREAPLSELPGAPAPAARGPGRPGQNWPPPAAERTAAAGSWHKPAAESGGLVQVAYSFIVRALGDGFELIDQHALHERIQYEALRAELAAGGIAVQRLLVPELIEVSRVEAEELERQAAVIARSGVQLERFGPDTMAVQGLPARLARRDPAGVVRDLLGFLAELGRAPSPEELLEAALQRAACRSAFMAGDELSPEQMRGLLEQAAGLENDQTCVHGRPTRVRFALPDLLRAFERR